MARLESVRSEHAIAMLQGRGPALYAEHLDRYPPLFLVEGMEEIQISYKHVTQQDRCLYCTAISERKVAMYLKRELEVCNYISITLLAKGLTGQISNLLWARNADYVWPNIYKHEPLQCTCLVNQARLHRRKRNGMGALFRVA